MSAQEEGQKLEEVVAEPFEWNDPSDRNGDVDSRKLSEFGEMYEYWIGILLEDYCDDVKYEDPVSAGEKRVTPDFQIVRDEVEVTVEVKSGRSFCRSQLVNYDKIGNSILFVLHDNYSRNKETIENITTDNHISVIKETGLPSFAKYRNTGIASSMRNKHDFLKQTELSEVRRKTSRLERLFRHHQNRGYSTTELQRRLNNL